MNAIPSTDANPHIANILKMPPSVQESSAVAKNNQENEVEITNNSMNVILDTTLQELLHKEACTGDDNLNNNIEEPLAHIIQGDNIDESDDILI